MIVIIPFLWGFGKPFCYSCTVGNMGTKKKDLLVFESRGGQRCVLWMVRCSWLVFVSCWNSRDRRSFQKYVKMKTKNDIRLCCHEDYIGLHLALECKPRSLFYFFEMARKREMEKKKKFLKRVLNYVWTSFFVTLGKGQKEKSWNGSLSLRVGVAENPLEFQCDSICVKVG